MNSYQISDLITKDDYSITADLITKDFGYSKRMGGALGRGVKEEDTLYINYLEKVSWLINCK